MHVVDCYGDSIKVVAERSHGYKGPTMNEEYVKRSQYVYPYPSIKLQHFFLSGLQLSVKELRILICFLRQTLHISDIH